MLQDILKEFEIQFPHLKKPQDVSLYEQIYITGHIIEDIKDFITHTYNTARKEQLAEVKDNLFKGFKAPKGNQFYSNGWKQCRYKVLDIIYLLNKKL